MSREKRIEERLELSDIIDYAIRDWDDYIEECHEEGNSPIDTFEEYIADAVLGAGYRKQIEGEWIINRGGGWLCGNCKKYSTGLKPFCSYCGAKMKGGE